MNKTLSSLALAPVFAIAAIAALAAPGAYAAPVDDAVTELQRDWEVVRYQTPAAEREKRFEVLATNGDTHLGGEDFDQRVMQYFVKLFQKKYNQDLKTGAFSLALGWVCIV